MNHEIDPVLKNEIAQVLEASKRKFAEGIEALKAEINPPKEAQQKGKNNHA